MHMLVEPHFNVYLYRHCVTRIRFTEYTHTTIPNFGVTNEVL